MLKQYNQPSLRIHRATINNIIITSDPNVGFDDGTTGRQDAHVRDTDWSSFDS